MTLHLKRGMARLPTATLQPLSDPFCLKKIINISCVFYQTKTLMVPCELLVKRSQSL